MDRFVAPEISTFTLATIPDMSSDDPEHCHWLEHFVLNSMNRVNYPYPDYQYLFNYIGKTEIAFAVYSLARAESLAYIQDRRIQNYMTAIGHWEGFLAQSWQALYLLVRGQKLFSNSDGSDFQRLNLLYNLTKHLDSVIGRREIPEGTTLAVWLKNDGLHSRAGSLTFDEMAEILKGLGRYASALKDPLTMTEKIGKWASGEE